MDSYNAPKLDVNQDIIKALNDARDIAVSIEAAGRQIVNEEPIEVETSRLSEAAIKGASQSKEIDGVPEWARLTSLGIAARLERFRSATEDGKIKVSTLGNS